MTDTKISTDLINLLQLSIESAANVNKSCKDTQNFQVGSYYHDLVMSKLIGVYSSLITGFPNNIKELPKFKSREFQLLFVLNSAKIDNIDLYLHSSKNGKIFRFKLTENSPSCDYADTISELITCLKNGWIIIFGTYGTETTFAEYCIRDSHIVKPESKLNKFILDISTLEGDINLLIDVLEKYGIQSFCEFDYNTDLIYINTNKKFYSSMDLNNIKTHEQTPKIILKDLLIYL